MMTWEQHNIFLIHHKIKTSTYILTNNPTPTATPTATIATTPTITIAFVLEVAGCSTSFLSATAQKSPLN